MTGLRSHNIVKNWSTFLTNSGGPYEVVATEKADQNFRPNFENGISLNFRSCFDVTAILKIFCDIAGTWKIRRKFRAIISVNAISLRRRNLSTFLANFRRPLDVRNWSKFLSSLQRHYNIHNWSKISSNFGHHIRRNFWSFLT